MISNRHFTVSDRSFLVRRVSDIKDRKCYMDIFKLLHKQKINYTRNSNGIFFNVSVLSNEVLNKIDFILSFHEFKIEKVSNNNI